MSGWCPAGPGQGRRRWRARRARRFCRSGCCCLCCLSSRGRLLAPACTTRRAAEEAARGPAGGRGAPSPGAALKTHPAQSHPGPDSSAVPTSHPTATRCWSGCVSSPLALSLCLFLPCVILFFLTHTQYFPRPDVLFLQSQPLGSSALSYIPFCTPGPAVPPSQASLCTPIPCGPKPLHLIPHSAATSHQELPPKGMLTPLFSFNQNFFFLVFTSRKFQTSSACV